MSVRPSLRERLRPAELLTVSGVIAAFSGLIVLMATRDWVITSIGFGVVFILAVLTTALLALSAKPDEAELKDLEEQDRAD